MADYLRAIALGLLQALTEFLPISSSGHLVLAPHLIGDEVSSLTFDVGLHLGTLFAVLVYFWREWADIAFAVPMDLLRYGGRVTRWSAASQFGLLIAIATVPAVIAGPILQRTLEEAVRTPAAVGISLLFFSGVIWAADRFGAQHLRDNDMTVPRAAAIGLAQAIALIPGTSRSGITIAAARALGFERPAAARFSFMMSAPVVAGAATLTLGGALVHHDPIAWGPMFVGAITAAIAGLIVIRVLLTYVQARSLDVFIWYRVGLACLVLAAVALGLL